MKIKHSFLTFLKLTVLMGILHFSSTCFAKEINLYDQPKADAKIVGNIDLAAGFIPIYTPKERGWVKIGDPRNGNVGWVKSNELNNGNSTQASFTFTQSYINDDNNKSPMTYRIVQFEDTSKLSTEQTQSIMKQMQIQQQSLQKSIQNMMRDMDQLFYDDKHFMPGNFPFLMPVVIMPIQNPRNANPQVPINKGITSVTSPSISSNQQQSNIKDKNNKM
jgi:hypothetical protein